MVGTSMMETSSGRTITLRSFAFDLAVAGLVFGPLAGRTHGTRGGLGAADLAAAGLTVALLVLRRPLPLPALAAGIVAAGVVTAIAERPTAVIPTVVILLFHVAVSHGRRTAVVAGGITLLALLVLVVMLVSDGLFGPVALAALAWPMLAVAAGDVVRSRRIAVEQALDAAEARARRAESSREEEARRRVVEERLRIARELHDVVAHRMAVVNVQAGVASHLLRAQPAAAEEALAVVRSSARLVLDELAGILSVLRTSDEPDTTEPVPGLAAIPALVESFHAAGLAVEWTSSGEPRPLPTSVELAAYRTVQEALTNAHKHGDGRVRLTIVHTADAVDVEAVNRVGTSRPPTAGFGLLGMRERVSAAGGTLAFGSTGGSFRLSARFPRTEREPS